MGVVCTARLWIIIHKKITIEINHRIDSNAVSDTDYRLEINGRIQWFTTQFPTHRNREFNSALQGINSGYQGIFSPDQGIPRWPRFHCDGKPNVRPTRG